MFLFANVLRFCFNLKFLAKVLVYKKVEYMQIKVNGMEFII